MPRTGGKPSMTAMGAMLALLVTGCASGTGTVPNGADSAATAAQTTSPPEAPAAATREVTVDIADGHVTPAPGRVEVGLGDTVRLTVTSDVADEVHVHGFDIAGPVGPDQPFETEFVADRDGAFEVETHDDAKLLFSLLVR
jgi:plastocyanin